MRSHSTYVYQPLGASWWWACRNPECQQSGGPSDRHEDAERESRQHAEQVTEYVVGFVLDRYRRVALIVKNRPAWQAGFLNGIGGHVEPGESADAAMRREFREETGADVDCWEPFVVMDFPGALITFYRAWIDPDVMDSLRTTTDEQVHVIAWWSPHEQALPADILPNLEWLLPLAAYTAESYEPIVVRGRS